MSFLVDFRRASRFTPPFSNRHGGGPADRPRQPLVEITQVATG